VIGQAVQKTQKGFLFKNASVCSEEFFFSEEGFGRDWRGYVLKTGRFLLRLRRPNPA
jgi:hypothetical protein